MTSDFLCRFRGCSCWTMCLLTIVACARDDGSGGADAVGGTASGGEQLTGGRSSGGGHTDGGGASDGGAGDGGSGPVGGSGGKGGASPDGGGGGSSSGSASSGSASSGGAAGGPRFGSVDDLVPNTTCSFDMDFEFSEFIGTVGILNLTTDLGTLDGGYVDFGPGDTFTYRAPLDLAHERYRTLLLGMSQDTDFSYRVLAQSGDDICESESRSVHTGSAPDGLPVVDFSLQQPDKAASGFYVTSTFGSEGYALILDDRGEIVWWYALPFDQVSRAALSGDGRFMYVRDSNELVQGSGKAARIATDGSSVEMLTVPDGHHDLSIAPDGVLFLTGDGKSKCGRIQILRADGTLEPIYDLTDAFTVGPTSGDDPCHCNSIRYNDFDDSITVSCRYHTAYIKVRMDGTLDWVLGGGSSHFSGDVEWNQQHGHHLLSPTRLVFFNNLGLGPLMPTVGVLSNGIELELDLENMVATRTRLYEGSYSSAILGDAQLLPNENLLMVYSGGNIEEIAPDDSIVAAWDFPDHSLGYANHHPTLYAPAPRR